ncbi:MAG: ABC transporter ATP-binding protein, partial [Methanosarcinaceae archaeon]|nr:ABC transporter ATP-binding protein [Methanosarcinaceae archaeon]
SPADRLKEIVLHRVYHKRFEALRNICFQVKQGETLGIVGQNGAGKSTLLKILTGILLPDSGTIQLDGKITGLLELGTGFQHDFSGLQNIYFNGALLGMSKEEIEASLDDIIGFTELEQFIHEPLKTYSSGMAMRLAFSIAIHANPKAFVVDEALAVGDAYFQQKCMSKISEFKNSGGSIVFVSHDLNAVKVLCDRALLLDHGRVMEEGDPEKVINTYNFLLAKKTKGGEICLRNISEKGKDYGNLKVTVPHVKLYNAMGEESEVLVCGERITIEIGLRAHEAVDDITVGILLRDKFGQDIFGTNTYNLDTPISLGPGENCLVRYILHELNIGPGKYTLTVAAHRDATHLQECYQWTDMVRTFEVVGGHDFQFIGLSRLKTDVQVDAAWRP